ncbi:leucine-rich repeat domain-containing protein [uncultured Alistipes sp.]|uniref:leucine-rich repeat domain-containing protein n=1 Tax=uncultured Alistipes sp. TaxID=538949 RepID=UPI0025EAD7B4|nr:leucine-rich repeat domain-containing protein [uncultured Alistipes sp.]
MKYCYENFDLNGDGAISKTEAAAVVSIGFSLSAVGDNPAPLTGIEYFPNIQEIRIYSEFLQSKVDIDLRHNKKLQYISLNLRPSGEGEIRAYIPETYEGNKRSDVGLTYCSQIYGKHASSDHRCWIVDGKLTDAASHGLTTYTIPDNVTTIGNWAFSYCKSLESVTIPKNVASIESRAFSDGNRLTLYCKPTTPPKLISDFSYTYIAKIYVPHSAVDAYKSADGWSEYANRIEGYDF